MANVVNVPRIATLIAELGWLNVSVPEIVEGLQKANIPAVELIAYLGALTASPGGCNDQEISGVTGSDAAKITNYLRGKGVVTT